MKMKLKTLAVLSFPLIISIPAFGLPLKDFQGTFMVQSNQGDCRAQIRLSPQEKVLFVFDASTMALLEQFPIGKTKSGDRILEGKLVDDMIIVEEFKSGLLGKKKVSERSLRLIDKEVLLTLNNLDCSYRKEALKQLSGSTKNFDPHGDPNKKYIPLKESFTSAEDLLDVNNADKVYSTLENLKSATPQYHKDLRDLTSTARLSLDQIKMIPELAYYTPSLQAQLVKVLKEGKNHAQSKSFNSNVYLAHDLNYVLVPAILSHQDDVKTLELAEYIDFLKAMPREILAGGYINQSIVFAYERKLKDLDQQEMKELLTFYRTSVSEDTTAKLASEIFVQEHSTFTVEELTRGSKELYPERPLAVLKELVAKSSDLDRETSLKVFAQFNNDSGVVYAILSETKGRISWTVEDLEKFKAMNISLSLLKACGFHVKDFHHAGYKLGGLLESGFTPNELRDDFSIQDFKSLGYGPRSLRNFGYTAPEIKEAGFSLNDLINAGFSIPNDLKKLYTIRDFKNIGYGARSLHGFGYSVSDIKEAGFSLNDLINAGFSIPNDLKKLYTIRDFKSLGYGARSLHGFGYAVSEIKEAGFSLNDLINSGFSIPNDLKKLYTIRDFKNLGYGARSLYGLGYTVSEIKEAGFSLSELIAAGFRIKEDLKPLFDAPEFLRLGYGLSSLRSFGFTASELRSTGASLEDLKNAGFGPAELAGL